ncbi:MULTISPECIES: GH25 family lysozyme [unclassified Sinorhizobium]|uniref:glycoside hydrolase family 25 protein n=1 Tax=unclassified Sinorhizobium TaxID=2613772 RepID=UPI0024C3F19D|nr:MULTISPECIES: GH25 family lysozyme [unclassified Sinorhizobium]MDK1374567.1 GH25 family lysozyme [Sinorhizobium sp. 6-70]MDK1478233.1 GH25 family lysozyme [Sinorhizobium sp. 6-117]
MRFSAVPVLLLAGLVLSGCGFSSNRERVAAQQPSRETTSSVAQSLKPMPVANVGAAASQAAPPQEMLAWAGSVPEPQAFVPVARTAGMPVPSERPIALLTPENPAIEEAPSTRGQIYSHRFRDAKPINFGSRSPRKLAVHGVDVSRWQGEINWAKLRTQGANFAYIKATDGGDHLDPMFKKNWRRAKEAGLKRGAYHFFYWCRTAGEQADWFMRNVPREAGALPPVIDVEWNGESSCKRRPSRERVLEKMQVFMDKLERHYGQRPIIYTAPDFYRDNLKGAFPNHPFWLRSVAAHPSKVYPGRKWLFWQYSGSGLSHGVDGRIDLNVFHGSENEWHRWAAAGASLASRD